MQLKSVVLPAPFGPIRPQIAPRATSKDTSSSAVTPPNRIVSPVDRQQGGRLEVRIVIRASGFRLGQLHGLSVPFIVRLVEASRWPQS